MQNAVLFFFANVTEVVSSLEAVNLRRGKGTTAAYKCLRSASENNLRRDVAAIFAPYVCNLRLHRHMMDTAQDKAWRNSLLKRKYGIVCQRQGQANPGEGGGAGVQEEGISGQALVTRTAASETVTLPEGSGTGNNM
ncbi:hypothetical protein WMY93_032003 [Mugilogobius chulae]|uniref:Uncharacterized protein n=1 Tax=Mugilogobius chulae TaxID=88201 RepID=A0AAW0MGM2_9GOBI